MEKEKERMMLHNNNNNDDDDMNDGGGGAAAIAMEVEEDDDRLPEHPPPNPNPNPNPNHHHHLCCISARRSRHSAASSICLPSPSSSSSSSSLTIRIREYRHDTDSLQIQHLERSSLSPKPSPPPPPGSSLFLLPTSPLGHPLSRVCTYPLFCMMVAELLPSPHADSHDSGGGACNLAIVGVVRAGLKQVTTRPHDRRLKDFVSLAYISGLRVAHHYRRSGIAQKLMREVEEWCRRQGAEYCYLATQKENEASVNLFTLKLGYSKFRTPLILVQPVAHSNKARRAIHYMAATAAAADSGNTIRIVKLAPEEAEGLYREEMGDKEFFPKDIDRILQSPLNAGTWAAFYDTRGGGCGNMEEAAREGGAAERVRRGEGKGWAMLSLWRYDKLIRFETATRRARWGWAVALKRVGKRVVPGGGRGAEGFGVQLVYGVQAAGENWREPLERLWRAAGEMAAAEGCRALAAELAGGDPLLAALPHTSCHHDLWYAKQLSGAADLPPAATAGASFFLDPRDF